MANPGNGVQIPPRLAFQDRLAAALVRADRSGRSLIVACKPVDGLNPKDLEASLAQAGRGEIELVHAFGGRAWALLRDAEDSPDGVPNGLGWARFPEDGRDPDVLMQCALAAVRGRSDEIRDKDPDIELGFNADWALHYQPQVELHSDRVIGFEALMGDPKIGPLPTPDALITRVLEDLEHFQNGASAALRIAINLSWPQIASGNGSALLDRHASTLAAGSVEIEVTESEPADSLARAEEHMTALQDQGLRFALDDFGAGFATVSLLERLPFDTLKIDKRYVAALDSGDEGVAEEAGEIIATAIALAQRRDLLVVAEGIERLRHKERLLELDCAAGQGFHFSPAVPLDQALRLGSRF